MPADVLQFPPDNGRQGQNDPLRTVNDIEEVAKAAEAAAAAALKVQRATRVADPMVRRAALNAMRAVIECAVFPPPADDPAKKSRILKAGRLIEEPLLNLRYRLSIARNARASIHDHWTILGVAMTLGACWGIVTSHYIAAICLIVARVVISVGLGYDSSLPFETATLPRSVAIPTKRITYSQSGTRSVARCVVGHLCDVLPLLALGSVLSANERPLWAYAVLSGACLMLLATLYRVSGLQVGTPMNRLTIERPLRIGSLLLALTTAGYWQHSVPETGAPLLGLAAAGPVIFAAIEVIRSSLRLHYSDLTAGPGDRSFVLSVHGTCGTRTYRSEIKRRAS